jgi:hypothetical protein
MIALESELSNSAVNYTSDSIGFMILLIHFVVAAESALCVVIAFTDLDD